MWFSTNSTQSYRWELSIYTKRKWGIGDYSSTERNSSLLLQKLSCFTLSKQLILKQAEPHSNPFIFSSFSHSSSWTSTLPQYLALPKVLRWFFMVIPLLSCQLRIHSATPFFIIVCALFYNLNAASLVFTNVNHWIPSNSC